MSSNAITLVTSVVLRVIEFSPNEPAKELLSMTRIVSLMCLFLNSLCENISSFYTPSLVESVCILYDFTFSLSSELWPIQIDHNSMSSETIDSIKSRKSTFPASSWSTQEYLSGSPPCPDVRCQGVWPRHFSCRATTVSIGLRFRKVSLLSAFGLSK